MKIGFLSLLTTLFVGLKLTDYIDWSWWVVLSPILFGVFMTFVVLTGMIYVWVVTAGSKRF